MRKLRTFTDEEKAEFKKQRIERRNKLSLPFQLGYYVGEQIVNRFLPTLSCDGMQTNTVISVTSGEADECKRLNDIWFGKVLSIRGDDEAAKHKATEGEWKAVRAYHEMLEAKYLKDTIDCNFGVLNIGEKDMSEFKKGIGIALWDCDCSHYLCTEEDIEVKIDDDAWYTVITLKRNKDSKAHVEVATPS